MAITFPTAYPTDLTNTHWQSKKNKLDKLSKSGLGPLLHGDGVPDVTPEQHVIAPPPDLAGHEREVSSDGDGDVRGHRRWRLR